MNQSTEWYAHHPDPRGIVEPPWQITLHLPDGTVVQQWMNPRLWCLYRGTSVGPDILQCALMALEQWLLDLCESNPDRVERWLLYSSPREHVRCDYRSRRLRGHCVPKT